MNNTKEYNKNMDIIVNSALRHRAIIYGNYVKNKIIMEYNKKTYFKSDIIKKKLNREYTNLDYHPETKDRNIVFNNIDLCFNSVKNVELFIDELCEKFDSVLKNDNSTKYRILHKSVKFDISVCVSASIEPPFGNTNLLTNSIIIKYEPDNYMFSKNTGLYLHDANKYNHLLNIIKLIRNKKDYAINDIINEKSATTLVLKIVNNMVNNIDVLNIDWMTIGIYTDNPCIICLENSSDTCLMKTSYFHHKCFCEYIRNTKIYNDIHNDKIEYYFTSPYREKCRLIFDSPFQKY